MICRYVYGHVDRLRIHFLLLQSRCKIRSVCGACVRPCVHVCAHPLRLHRVLDRVGGNAFFLKGRYLKYSVIICGRLSMHTEWY